MRSSIPTHPYPFEINENEPAAEMKLSDVQSEEARARLRASNLDDLENAFKDESPLSETSAEMMDEQRMSYMPQVPVPPQASLYNQEIQQPSYRNDNLESFLIPPKVSQQRYRNDNLESFLSAPKEKSAPEEKETHRDDNLESFLSPPKNKSAPEEKEIVVKPVLSNIDEASEREEQDTSSEESKEEIVAINETKREKKVPDRAKNESLAKEKSAGTAVTFLEPNPFDTAGGSDESDDDNDAEYDPFSFGGRKEEELSPVSTNQRPPERQLSDTVRQPSRPVLVINGAELNSPKRRTCLATLLIIGAALGFAFSITQPPRIKSLNNSSENPDDKCKGNRSSSLTGTDVFPTPTILDCFQPTISPVPTRSKRPSQMPTLSSKPSASPIARNIYDFTYEKIQRFIVDSQITSVSVLPAECYYSLCGRGKVSTKMTIQQKVVNHLIDRDPIFFQWIAQDKLYDHAERVIQRYVFTLMAFSLDSNNWTNHTNWPTPIGLVASNSECEWFGLECADRSAYTHLKDFVDHTFLAKTAISGREVEIVPMVTTIVLKQNMLNGELPQELFKLRHLVELKIHNNKISGTIPKSVGLLSDMKKLWIHNTTDLGGTIPTTIGNMSSLTSLWIGLNKVEGTIPKEIGNLERLQTLGLLSNKIQGTIPKEIVKLKNMRNLFLDFNQLNGTLPALMGQLSNLKDLRLDNNLLSGTLPFSLSELKKLETFYGYKNTFTGDIGNNFVVGWDSLEKLELFDNKLTGTISPYFGQLPKLITLDLHKNKFNSTITSQLCTSGTLTKLDLGSNNKITGKIPDLSKCKTLTTLDLSDNDMTGTVPFYFMTLPLKYLNLKGNRFTGPLPKGLCNPTQIPSCNTDF